MQSPIRWNIFNYYDNRIFGLDVLRALAILLVMARHSAVYGFDFIPQKTYRAFFFYDGVTLFFVLSGFLVGRILIRLFTSEDLSFKKVGSFWKRRWLRTMPNYFLVLLAILIFKVVFQGAELPSNIWQMFVFSHTLTEHNIIYIFSDSWSLCVEEWFYLVTPLILFGSIGLFKKWLKVKHILLVTCLIIAFISIYYRFQKSLNMEEVSMSIYIIQFRNVVLARLDSLMIGVMAAYLSIYKPKVWMSQKILLLVVGIILVVFNRYYIQYCLKLGSYQSYLYTLSFDVESLGYALLLPFCAQWKRSKGLLYKVITFISLISYALYVLNLNLVSDHIIPFLSNRGLNELPIVWSGFTKYILYYVASFFFAYLLFVCFEYPIMQLRKKMK